MAFGLLLAVSSPEDAFADVTAFLARREPRPPGAAFAERRWLTTGVVGRDVSGVGTGVASVEVVLLYDTCG